MPRGLEESFLEFPIPRRTQEAIANCFWGDTEFQLQPYFQYYTDQCRLAVQSYGLPVKTHQDLINIATDILKDISLQDVKAKLVERCSQSNEAYSEDNLHAAIHLAVRLIYMLDVGEFRNAFSGRRKLVWRNGPLRTFIQEIFSKEIHLEHDRIKLGPVFNVCNIVRIGGFKVELTTNLADHLLLRDADKTLTIFHHASFLMGQRQCSLFPDSLVDETLRTLALLFPQGDRDTEKWYKRQDNPEELDYNVLKCGSANRHIEGYIYWHDRLVILKEAFDESRPSTISQWWNDRRDGVQCHRYGGSRGIGERVALELAQNGAKVSITYTSTGSEARVNALVNSINALDNGVSAIAIKADLRDPLSPSKIVAETVQHFGGHVDILVNNAGVELVKPLQDVTVADFGFIYDLNVRAPTLMLQVVLPHLRAPGRIINIGSVGGRHGFKQLSVYCSSKSALEGLTRCWAAELGLDGHAVNCVNPGPVQTELMDNIPKETIEMQRKQTHIENRIGTVNDVAPVVVWLAKEESRWVTGQVLSVSGGWAMY